MILERFRDEAAARNAVGTKILLFCLILSGLFVSLAPRLRAGAGPGAPRPEPPGW